MAKETYSAGGVVLDLHGRVLVVNQHGNSWSLPKGHIESQENAMMAAKREIYEETGIQDLTFVRELGAYQRYRIAPDGGEDPSEFKNITMFLFKTNQEFLKPIDPENPEARWIEKELAADLLTHPKDREFFLKVMDLI
ncbi:NUDIX domain-containing protein [Candidatus Peregrinibacteria bacterium]|nr:NUDIX domain-containing protein [Candidatus Peregrinibacteria bacterium]